MQNQLGMLDRHLKKLRPGFYSKLNPPLDDGSIKVLEIKYSIVLPDDLKNLYGWKNGQIMNCYDSFVNNSTFMPLEYALSSGRELTSMIGTDFEIVNWWNENWIPIFHNGGGDHICYDLAGVFTGRQGQLIEFWHADNDRNVIAPDLKTFIEAVNRFYETNDVTGFDEYFEIESITGYPEKFTVD